MRKSNGKHPEPATDTNVPVETHEAEYRAAVEAGKAIVASISGKQWELGDLAAEVGKVYGENRLERFAEDINFPGAACTLRRYAVVCRAFPEKRGRPRFFASAQVLAAHPNCEAIVEANPDISKKQAREIMRLWRAEQGGTTAEQTEEDDLLEEADTEPTATGADAGAEQPGDDDPIAPGEDTEPTPGATATPAKAKGPKKPVNEEQAEFNESKRLLGTQVKLANDMIATAEARKKTPPEQRRHLGKAAAALSASLETMCQAGEAWREYVDWLKKLAAEAKETAIGEGRIRNSPKPAASSEPAQAAV